MSSQPTPQDSSLEVLFSLIAQFGRDQLQIDAGRPTKIANPTPHRARTGQRVKRKEGKSRPKPTIPRMRKK